MKKYLSGLIAAFMLAAGLVTVSGGVASAAPARACTATKYVQCPATSTKGTAPKTAKHGKKVKTSITVRANGNVKPQGTVTVTFKGPGLNKTVKATYKGKTLSVTSPALKKKGTYTITITFTGTNTKGSKTVVKVKVK